MKPFIFSVNALAGGGKTSTTRELENKLKNAKALYFDDRNYDSDSGIDDIVKWINDGADVNLWDLRRLADDIDRLINESYDFIVLDYPFGYKHNLIGSYLDYSVFIDTPLDINLARRILRDYDKKTMISCWTNSTTIFDDMEYYLQHGRNAYIKSLEGSKADADLIIDGSLSLDMIVEYICNDVILRKTNKLANNK